MIETPGALAMSRRSLALDTVDGLFIGPSDLVDDPRARPFKFATAMDQADFRTVAAAARKLRKVAGHCRRRAPRLSRSPSRRAPIM